VRTESVSERPGEIMKRLISALVVGVASVTLLVPAAPANAGGCVSRGEFRHVHRGMPMARVHHVFGTKGHLKKRVGRRVIRVYNPCPSHSAISVVYRRHHLSGKAAAWHR